MILWGCEMYKELNYMLEENGTACLNAVPTQSRISAYQYRMTLVLLESRLQFEFELRKLKREIKQVGGKVTSEQAKRLKWYDEHIKNVKESLERQMERFPDEYAKALDDFRKKYKKITPKQMIRGL